MPTRDLANKRVTLWLGLASALGQYTYATEAELAAMLKVAPAVRWDGYDFGMQASEQIDDRSLDDSATATIRGFMQFGGGIPFYLPKLTDTNSIVRQAYNLLKTRGTQLVIVQRVGFVDRRAAGLAGDNISIFRAMTDGYVPDTEGTGGYAAVHNLLPQGDVAPWTIVRGASATAVTIGGGAVSLSVASGNVALRTASYLGNDITNRAQWLSSNPAVATVDNRGIIEPISAGTAQITAGFPGGTTSTPVTVTVT